MIRLQGGDARAFDELVARHQGPLYGFFLRNTRDVQFAEDLTQETLLRVYSQSWDYLPSGRFRSWMYRIGRNLLIDSIRRQSTDALVHAVIGHGNGDDGALARLAGEVLSPVDVARHRELVQMVDDVLAGVAEEQRLTFLLHHYAGLSLPEVAEVMETNVATTKSRLRLAREKLQEHLRERGVAAE
ncbi:MAG TPA: sigma-70 family RNA polymerase sigma factor [Planctomycetaceae bacterium]|nr:sigma-70 family RNA polymerase sigma factor [Planctomycetaceae bacterium]